MTSHSNTPITQDIDGVQYEFVYNSKGTLIKKCCASCKYKQPKDQEGPRRTCTYNPNETQTVYKSDCCVFWNISEETDRLKTACSKRQEESDDETSE